MDVLTGRSHLYDVSRINSFEVFAFHRFDSIGRRYDRRGSGGPEALNHDCTYPRRWFILLNSRAGDSVFAIRFRCFSSICCLV